MPQKFRKEPPVRSRAIRKASELASGAVLAVLLLSIGIVIGRYQLDGTELGLTNMLVLAAAFGAAWASFRTSRRDVPDRRERPDTSLRINNRTAMRVEDVIRAADRQHASSTTPDRRPAPPRPAEAPDAMQEMGEPMPTMSPRVTPNGQITTGELAATGEDDSLADSSDLPRQSSDASHQPPPDVSTFERSHQQPDDVNRIDSHMAGTPGGGQEVPPVGAPDDVETDESHASSQAPDSGSSIPVDAEGPSAEASDLALLPTAAIRRYLASLSRLQAEASTRTGSPGDTIEDSDANHSTDVDLPLTEIRGIGPALTSALKQLGITTVHDLAALNPSDIDHLEEQLGAFGMRIRSGRWVEQARQMIGDE
jgi:predicted flap endonuclease-1-like 5' DNA nuclease